VLPQNPRLTVDYDPKILDNNSIEEPLIRLEFTRQQGRGSLMAGNDWDNHLQLDLVRLKSELSAQSIRVIGPGLGFGHFYQKDRSHDQPPHAAHHFANSQPLKPRGFDETHLQARKKIPPIGRETTMGNAAVQQMAQDFAVPASAHPRERNAKIQENHLFYKFVKSYIVDIVFVTGTLLVVLCGIGLAFDGHHLVWNWQELQGWLPIRFLVESSKILMGVGFVGVFLVYWLFFKFVAGHTLGESLIGQESKRSKASSGL